MLNRFGELFKGSVDDAQEPQGVLLSAMHRKRGEEEKENSKEGGNQETSPATIVLGNTNRGKAKTREAKG